MNLVGKHGKGESVWLGFFLYDVLTQFADLAAARGDVGVRRALPAARRRSCAATSSSMAWDGGWYRRAYFDDGTPLGSASEPGMPDRFDRRRAGPCCPARAMPERSRLAMDAVDQRLVRRDHALIQLLGSAVRQIGI